MERVAALLAPDTGSPTPPKELRADFEEVVTQLDEAEQHAPAAISDDVTAFATAIDDYVVALAAADYDLNTIFSTPEGTRLAETPHTPSPPTWSTTSQAPAPSPSSESLPSPDATPRRASRGTDSAFCSKLREHRCTKRGRGRRARR